MVCLGVDSSVDRYSAIVGALWGFL
jgi:hypothetical protein